MLETIESSINWPISLRIRLFTLVPRVVNRCLHIHTHTHSLTITSISVRTLVDIRTIDCIVWEEMLSVCVYVLYNFPLFSVRFFLYLLLECHVVFGFYFIHFAFDGERNGIVSFIHAHSPFARPKTPSCSFSSPRRCLCRQNIFDYLYMQRCWLFMMFILFPLN